VSTLKITIHSTGPGTCSLTGKNESDGITVSFEDGTIQQAFLSWKGFRQLLSLKAKRTVGADPKVAGKLPDSKAPQG
jgi:hypothetical protein